MVVLRVVGIPPAYPLPGLPRNQRFSSIVAMSASRMLISSPVVGCSSNLGSSIRPLTLRSATAKKSKSLCAVNSPRAADPNRMS